jgi:hypothetical protein
MVLILFVVLALGVSAIFPMCACLFGSDTSEASLVEEARYWQQWATEQASTTPEQVALLR